MGPYLMDKVKLMILVGTTSPKIKEAAELEAKKRGEDTMPIVEFENLKDAVEYAKENTSSGDIVAMSPASASFDLYKNFMIRGDYFKELVNNI
jgi:UDP-N-acetylmuramoylalanine--D-glutamate ligase